jgi:diaminopimelate epimerase
MKIEFFKYQGAGNDFVIIDNRNSIFPKDNYDLIQQCCDRKYGIGADGLMLLENDPNSDFKMEYYNANGHPGSMCGNGGRCIVAFAKSLGIFEKVTNFEALGEMYQATISDLEVSLKMIDVNKVEVFDDHVFLDTGSPHHVAFVENISEYDVVNQGRKIRNGAPYHEAGTNVNFVEKLNHNTFSVRTFERGVEDETLSCGTGVTAVALASYHLDKTSQKTVHIETLGGKLKIEFQKDNNVYKNIILTGPATFVFQGIIEI